MGLSTTPAWAADTDNDGLEDAQEATLGTDPNNPDTDADALTDGAEVNTHLTNPLVVDTDADGLGDGAEVNTHLTNPRVADTDGDGLNDGPEKNVHLTNPLLADTDADGLTDGSEVNTHLTNPLVADTDADGLNDGPEKNTHNTNPLLADTDADGLSDGAEVTTHLTNPLAPDTDGDGLNDGPEKNTHLTNPLIPDTDGDGLTDGSEVNTHHSNPLAPDTDADGLSDGAEVNVHQTNPTSADTDADGLGDGAELNTHQTNPLVADTDSDGLTDGAEVNVHQTNPLDADTDDDGLNDGPEKLTYFTKPLVADTDGDTLSDGTEVNTTHTDPLSKDTDNDWVNDNVDANPLQDDRPTTLTWTLLPTAQWSNPFVARYVNQYGYFIDGDPTPVPENYTYISRQEWDDVNDVYDTIWALQNEALVGFLPAASVGTIEDLMEDAGLGVEWAWFDPDPTPPAAPISLFHVTVKPTSEFYNNVPGLLAYLQAQPGVEFAEFNDVGQQFVDEVQFTETSVPPSSGKDLHFASPYGSHVDTQWRYLDLIAWDVWQPGNGGYTGKITTLTGRNACVVVIDGGVDVDHPDLKDKIYRNPYTHTDPSAWIRQGIVKSGKNYALGPIDSDTNQRTLETTKEGHGHGTVVAGIIGAETGNGIGVVGCGPDVQILPARYIIHKEPAEEFDDPPGPKASDIAKIIAILENYFTGSGYENVRVVNMSFGFKKNKSAIEKAITRDLSKNDRLYIGAAADDDREKKYWPAADIRVLGVTSVERTGFGPAPLSALRWGGRAFWNGGTKTGSQPDTTVYGVSGFDQWFVSTDVRGTAGYNVDNDRQQESDIGWDYVEDVRGASVAAAQVSALAALMYAKAINNNQTPTRASISNRIIQNTRGDPVAFQYTWKDNDIVTKRVPSLIDFEAALNSQP